MAVQLAFPLSDHHVPTLAGEIDALAVRWGSRTGAPAHAETSAAITAKRFAEWNGRSLSGPERKRVEAYFLAVLRRRIVVGRDVDAQAARSRLIARSIEQDLVDAGWDRARATRQARSAAGIALSA